MHRLRELDRPDPGGQERGEDVAGGLAGIVNAGEEILPFRRGDPFQRLDRDPGALREPAGRVRRTSVSVERHSDGGAGQLARLLFLAVGHPFREQGQPARRAHRLNLRGADAGAQEPFPRERSQLLQGRGDEPGRKLLAANLEEERPSHGPRPRTRGLPPPSAREGAGIPSPPSVSGTRPRPCAPASSRARYIPRARSPRSRPGPRGG